MTSYLRQIPVAIFDLPQSSNSSWQK